MTRHAAPRISRVHGTAHGTGKPSPGAGRAGRGGRPRKEIAKADIPRIQQLASVLNEQQIADFLGMSHDTFQRRKADDPEVLRAYKAGRAKAIAGVGATLLELCRKKNVQAIIFYLKTQAGWKERQGVDVSAFDPNECTDQQLERIAAGESVDKVAGRKDEYSVGRAN